MGVRSTKSADELREIVSTRLRMHPECLGVRSVMIVSLERPANHLPNWKALFAADGAGLAPAKAFVIALEVSMEFDLAPGHR